MLIVDGNNVMGSRPDGWWRDRAGAARRLAAQLAAADLGEPVVVVFDGRRPQDFSAPEGLRVLFAERSGRDAADDVIARLVADDPEPSAIRVATSDTGLAGRVREHGAQVLGSRALLDRLG